MKGLTLPESAILEVLEAIERDDDYSEHNFRNSVSGKGWVRSVGDRQDLTAEGRAELDRLRGKLEREGHWAPADHGPVATALWWVIGTAIAILVLIGLGNLIDSARSPHDPDSCEATQTEGC